MGHVTKIIGALLYLEKHHEEVAAFLKVGKGRTG
jgi:hypothetical protein